MSKHTRSILLITAIAALMVVLAACAPAAQPTTEATSAPTEAATEAPTEVMTEAPTEVATEEGSDLGTEDNPIIMSFVPSSDSQEVLAGAEEIGNKVAEITGYTIKSNVATEYAGVITAMCNGEAHVGALNTFSYVLAHQQGCADVALTSVRNGATSYTAQIITRADSGIKTIEDLKGKTFCRPDPLSTSGWIIPMLTMQAAGLNTDTDLKEVVDAGGHDGVVNAVYNGDCDAGSTFTDARTLVQEDKPDVMEKVVVIQESQPIPNDTISFSSDVPDDVKEAITAAFLQIAGDAADAELLNSVYRWAGLEEVDDSFYDPFRQQLDAAGLDVTDLMPQP